MNVALPMQKYEHAFGILMGISVLISLSVVFWMTRRR